MKVEELMLILSEQDPKSEVIVVAESYTEKTDYHYSVETCYGVGDIVYIETCYNYY